MFPTFAAAGAYLLLLLCELIEVFSVTCASPRLTTEILRVIHTICVLVGLYSER